MALTPFGKELRRLRIDRDMLLKNMADQLEMSSAFLSGVESGRKQIPSGFVEKLKASFNLSFDEVLALQEAAVMTAREVRINLGGNPSRLEGSVAALLARQFPDLSIDQMNDIKNILDRRKA